MYLNEQIPMVCLGCLENKYFPRDLIFGAGKNATEPSGTAHLLIGSSFIFLSFGQGDFSMAKVLVHATDSLCFILYRS